MASCLTRLSLEIFIYEARIKIPTSYDWGEDAVRHCMRHSCEDLAHRGGLNSATYVRWDPSALRNLEEMIQGQGRLSVTPQASRFLSLFHCTFQHSLFFKI